MPYKFFAAAVIAASMFGLIAQPMPKLKVSENHRFLVN